MQDSQLLEKYVALGGSGPKPALKAGLPAGLPAPRRQASLLRSCKMANLQGPGGARSKDGTVVAWPKTRYVYEIDAERDQGRHRLHWRPCGPIEAAAGNG